MLSRGNLAIFTMLTEKAMYVKQRWQEAAERKKDKTTLYFNFYFFILLFCYTIVSNPLIGPLASCSVLYMSYMLNAMHSADVVRVAAISPGLELGERSIR